MFRDLSKWAIGFTMQLAIVWSLHSQEIIQPEIQYKAGDSVLAPSYGIKMVMPENWRGLLARETIVYTILCDTLNDATVYLIPTDEDLETRLEQWKNGITIISGETFSAKENLKITQNSLKASFASPTNKSLKVVGYASHGPYSIGYSMFLTYQHERSFDYGELLDKVSTYISFQKPTPPPEVSWEDRLLGKYLYSYERKAGSTRINQLWLCNDGTFKSVSKGRGIYKDLNKEYLGSLKGTYEIKGSGRTGSLTLYFKKADPITVELELFKDHMYINGKRFYYAYHNECDE